MGHEPLADRCVMLRPLVPLASSHLMSTCPTCGASSASPTAGCATCALSKHGTDATAEEPPGARLPSNVLPIRGGTTPAAAVQAAAGAFATPHSYPNYDVEGLPDAHHDEMGAVYNTGKIRALKANGSTGSAIAAHRPPVLASEALREDLRPHEPGTRAIGLTGAGCGAAIAALGAWTLGGSLAGVALVALGAALACSALLPLRYALKATVQVALATALLAGSTVANVIGNADARSSLALPVIVLATGLLFRSWHRASHHARMIVALGILLAGAWLGWSESVDVVLGGDSRWQSWLPATTRLVLAPLLLAGLLAFMGEATTGGCAAWAAAVLAWYGAVSAIETVAAAAAEGSAIPVLEALQAGSTAARIVGALAAPMLALGIAQLLVVAASDPLDATTAQRPT